jgi:hypothetical protein
VNDINAKLLRDFTDLRDDVKALAVRAEKIDPSVAKVLYTLSGTLLSGDYNNVLEYGELADNHARAVLRRMTGNKGAA